MSRQDNQARLTDDAMIEARLANMCGQLKCSLYDIIRIAKRLNQIIEEDDRDTTPTEDGELTSKPDRCRNGHKYSPENTAIDHHGHRVCRVCKRRTDRAASVRRANRKLSLSIDASMARHPAGKKL